MPNNQLDQINEMIASTETFDSGIVDDIKTGNYNRVGQIDKCNIFVDDMLKKYWNVNLPKRREFSTKLYREIVSSGKGAYSGFLDNPASASTQGMFFEEASRISGTGIKEVDSMKGSVLSSMNRPVVVFGAGHATLSAPHQKWPLVYRSNLSGRGGDTRTAVGLKSDHFLKFYEIDPKQYSKFRSIMKDFTGEDVMYTLNEDSDRIRKILSEEKTK